MSSSTALRPPVSSALSRSQFTSTSSASATSTSPNTCGCRCTSLATSPSATSSMSHRPSSAAICAWKVTCRSRSPSSSRSPASSSASIASSSSCVSSSRWRASVRCVCSWSHGHPSGSRRRACTRIRSSTRCAALRRRHRPVRGRLAHGEAGTPFTASTDGDTVALGSVLVIRTTWSCWSSKRPKLGSTVIWPSAFCCAHPGAELVDLRALQDLVASLVEGHDLLADLPDHVPAVLRLHRLGDLAVLQRERGVGELAARAGRRARMSSPPSCGALGSVDSFFASAWKSARVNPGAVTWS